MNLYFVSLFFLIVGCLSLQPFQTVQVTEPVLMDLKGDINSTTVIMDRSTRQKFNREVTELIHRIEQMEITEIYRTLNRIAAENTFFSSVFETCLLDRRHARPKSQSQQNQKGNENHFQEEGYSLQQMALGKFDFHMLMLEARPSLYILHKNHLTMAQGSKPNI